MNDTSGIGTRVRSLRRRAGLSQARLASMVGISGSYLNLIEHNRRRMPADLMFKVASALRVDVREFATDELSGLQEELMDVLADPVFDDPDIKAVDVRAFAETNPGIARALTRLYRRWRSSSEAMESLGGLLLDRSALADAGASRLPSEEVNDLVQRNMNHFPRIEEAADDLWRRYRLTQSTLFEGLVRILEREQGIHVEIARPRELSGVLRRFDPATRTLVITEALPPRSRHFHMAHQLGLGLVADEIDRLAADPQLTTDASRRLARMVLANYFAGAMLMPYVAFLEAAEAERYDIELLGHRFRTSFEQVCHRLTTLRRPGMEGVPFHLVKTDTAGNVSKRFSGSGISFARFSGGCPRWNVNTAFMAPGTIRRQLSQMPDGNVYFCVARTVIRRHGGFHEPETVHAIGLGCLLEHAPRVVYADGLDLDPVKAIPIGTNCRTCERLDCAQRAFPSLKAPLRLDENERRIAFYAQDGEGGAD